MEGCTAPAAPDIERGNDVESWKMGGTMVAEAERLGVLFVCTGNICRSPTAEVVFRKKLDRAGLAHRIRTDSAGLHDFHVGDPPDRRSRAAATNRGYHLDDLRARQVTARDFHSFQLILAMDRGHLAQLRRLAPGDRQERLDLFLSYAPETGFSEVPDPYYGGRAGFEHVLDLVEAGASGLLVALRDRVA